MSFYYPNYYCHNNFYAIILVLFILLAIIIYNSPWEKGCLKCDDCDDK